MNIFNVDVAISWIWSIVRQIAAVILFLRNDKLDAYLVDFERGECDHTRLVHIPIIRTQSEK